MVVTLVYGREVVDFDVSMGVFYSSGKGTIVCTPITGDLVEVGSKIELVAYGKTIFIGYVRHKRKMPGKVELEVVAESDELFRNYQRRIIYPEDVGKTEKMDIADVVRYIVDTYTNFTHTDANGNDTIKDTGIEISKFVLNEYLSNALDRLAKAVGWIWYVKNDTFYFEAPKYVSSGITLTNSNAYIGKWKVKTDRLVNELHLIGKPIEYSKSDYFRGDGTKTEFRLSYIPSGTVHVYVNGVEVSSDQYDVDYDIPAVIFKDAPPAFTGTDDTLAQKFPGWTWKRKISIQFSDLASSVTNPTVAFGMSSSDGIDWTKMNSNLTDVRFAWVDSNGKVWELPFYFLGVDVSKRWFVIVLRGWDGSSWRDITVNNGSTVEIYMLYGNSEATEPQWTIDDIESLSNGSFWQATDFSSVYNVKATFVVCCDIDGDGLCETDVVHGRVKREYYKGYYHVEIYDTNNYCGSFPSIYILAVDLYVTADMGFVYLSPNERKIDVGISVTAEAFGPAPLSLTFYNGWWAYKYPGTVTTTIFSEEINASYNIEVKYSFKAPIYVKYEDVNSQTKYGKFSKVIRANWIDTVDMANLMATKYVSQYREPQYENTVKIVTKSAIDWGIEPGNIVNVDDRLHDINGSFVVYSIKYRPGVSELFLGTVAFDIFEWGAKVEERIRQLEVAGDENFFTP